MNQDEVDEANAAIKSWKAPKDDKNAKCPIQRVKPHMGYVFEYSTNLERVLKSIIEALDNVISSMAKVEQVEKMLMNKIKQVHW